MSTQSVVEYILMLPKVDLFAIFNNGGIGISLDSYIAVCESSIVAHLENGI